MKEQDVIEIRQLVKDKTPHKGIAKQFNISPKSVSDIARGRSYKRFGGYISKPYECNRKLTYEMQVDVLQLNYWHKSGRFIADYLYDTYELEVEDTTINKFIREFTSDVQAITTQTNRF